MLGSPELAVSIKVSKLHLPFFVSELLWQLVVRLTSLCLCGVQK